MCAAAALLPSQVKQWKLANPRRLGTLLDTPAHYALLQIPKPNNSEIFRK